MASTSRNSGGDVDENDVVQLEFRHGQNDLQDIVDELQIEVSRYAYIPL